MRHTVQTAARCISVQAFAGCINVLPMIACGREPGGWGYPGCVWVAVGWMRWSVQISLYADNTRSTEGEHQ